MYTRSPFSETYVSLVTYLQEKQEIHIQKLKTDAEKGYQHNQISAEVAIGKKTERDQLVQLGKTKAKKGSDCFLSHG